MVASEAVFAAPQKPGHSPLAVGSTMWPGQTPSPPCPEQRGRCGVWGLDADRHWAKLARGVCLHVHLVFAVLGFLTNEQTLLSQDCGAVSVNQKACRPPHSGLASPP